LGRNAVAVANTPFEKLSTCVALIELVHSCNLKCPTCYADSPHAADSVDAVPLLELQARIDGVIARKGKIEILQMSGGEPTLHPEFFPFLDWAMDHPGIDYLLLNTNGLRIAGDANFARELALRAPRRKLQVYLQFDGTGEAGQVALRGADLRGMREQAIARCGAMDLPVTLAMTVTCENLDQTWSVIDFGLRHPHIHGVTFQPMFGSGRNALAAPAMVRSSPPTSAGSAQLSGSRGIDAPPKNTSSLERLRFPLNAADVLRSAIDGSSGQMSPEDFTPLPCGDPNCAIIGYLLRLPGGIHHVSEFVDFNTLHGFLSDRLHYTVADLAECGCETEPLGAVLKKLELKASVAFRIMVKPFMDAWTWDQDRIDRCCTHVIRPDGALDSFCRYYAGLAQRSNGRPA
jgi:hypothetical protein